MPNQTELELNATASAQHVVGPEDLASSLPIEMGDNFPAVFATARMVALMEIAAAWTPTTPEMEVKVLLGRHIWDFAQHADALGKRPAVTVYSCFCITFEICGTLET